MLLVSMQQILRIHHLSLELVEVVTRAVNWPAEKEDVRSKKNKKNKNKGRTLLAFSCTTSTPGTDVFFLIFALTCRDRRRNRFPVEFTVHKHNMNMIMGEGVQREFGQAQVDLFASRETSHCPLWFSLTHPAPLRLDAMVQTCPRFRLHAFSQSLCSRESWREFAGY